MDSHAQIRALNVELAKKVKLIDDLKMKVQHFTSRRNAREIGQDEDIVEYLVNIVKEKERIVEELSYKVQQLAVSLILSKTVATRGRDEGEGGEVRVHIRCAS